MQTQQQSNSNNNTTKYTCSSILESCGFSLDDATHSFLLHWQQFDIEICKETSWQTYEWIDIVVAGMSNTPQLLYSSLLFSWCFVAWCWRVHRWQKSMVVRWLDTSQLNAIKQNLTQTKIIGQSNSIKHLIFKSSFSTSFEGSFGVMRVFFMVLRLHNMIFLEANLFIKHNWTQSIGLCLTGFGCNVIDWVQLDSTLFDWVFNGLEIELIQNSVLDFVGVRNSIQGLCSTEFDEVQFPKCLLDYASCIPYQSFQQKKDVIFASQYFTQHPSTHLPASRTSRT